MNPVLRCLSLILLSIPAALNLGAQTVLAPDQNPDYAVSRSKYLKTADSITTWHGNTFQQTYKAIDYLENKREAREARRAFRRELRLEEARHGFNYYSGFYPGYQNALYYGAGYYARNHASGYRRHNSVYISKILPWALTLGLLYR